ncbi:cell wall biogenesis protein-like protein Mhp1 [Calycina marina]|uniref:Cell wall biogenesis protein-like protein Mhp1 n=1 Tax=Calycina marina TaxID=1763456 RepID=A0A9P7YXT0_9HELO|nr:cell wall biogenesis protein-like protein Mhp1 [Calycina marina]
MESVHGVDVSWMHRTTSNTFKEQSSKSPIQPPSPIVETAISNKVRSESQAQNRPSSPKTIPPRPSSGRTASSEKVATNGISKSPSPGPTSRRNSWLSSISSKFSPTSHNPNSASPQSPLASTPEGSDTAAQNTSKSALLPYAAKTAGDVPYIPAPPKSTQPGFIQSALRRLSSPGGQFSNGSKTVQHGLCERKVLNVDRHRERCHIAELNQAKLRRVAFCVDVEIAGGPRYNDEDEDETKKVKQERKKQMEKVEGTGLKNINAVLAEKDEETPLKKATIEECGDSKMDTSEVTITAKDEPGAPEKDTTKKKEKKKRSEEERKARKEKKRRLAEANGTVPVEMVRDDFSGSQSSLHAASGLGQQSAQVSPTVDPLRIYRRCCQLRETPILKKITEQLATAIPGAVKLDLTDYTMQLPDLITLGDYLAVVPVKELIMENCGLTDEGIRVVLAGLLAAKPPMRAEGRPSAKGRGQVYQGGVVERVILTNNAKIGRDGWRHLSLFINMCRSLKSLDLSKVPFPKSQVQSSSSPHSGNGQHKHVSADALTSCEISKLLSKAIGDRLAGSELELMNLAECGISTNQLHDLLDGAIKSGLKRLGLAGNSITSEGMQHVTRFIRGGCCEGLDLGGNNLQDQLGVIAEAVNENSPLFALSLRDCNITPDSLLKLFPALVELKNFRFIDLSQNHALFEHDPSALSLLRRYLPKMPILKRIHLTDVSMSPEQAIALAEILPDTPSLAHVNLLENPKLFALANARNEANQEEACALYASLMAAVRVSKTIICIDIEVPSNESSEVVKALAKQVVAYCLYNMEHGPVAEISETPSTIQSGSLKEVTIPDVLLHLVGHHTAEDSYQEEGPDGPAPDDDYVIGGTGVVKALGICLRNTGNDSRRPSSDRTISESTGPVGGKAKQMSKNLLGSARNIRARLQPALVKESKGDQAQYARLMFLDATLSGMIKRFEDEFPETRLPDKKALSSLPTDTEKAQGSPVGSLENWVGPDGQTSDNEELALVDTAQSDDEYGPVRPVISRHNSDVSLASKAFTEEEGRMHRFGQRLRRDLVYPDDDATNGHPVQQGPNIRLLRAMVEGICGEEVRRRLANESDDYVLEELNNEASDLKTQLIEQDPENWKIFAKTMEVTHRNSQVAGIESFSAIE